MVLWKKVGRSGDGKWNNLLGWPNSLQTLYCTFWKCSSQVTPLLGQCEAWLLLLAINRLWVPRNNPVPEWIKYHPRGNPLWSQNMLSLYLETEITLICNLLRVLPGPPSSGMLYTPRMFELDHCSSVHGPEDHKSETFQIVSFHYFCPCGHEKCWLRNGPGPMLSLCINSWNHEC